MIFVGRHWFLRDSVRNFRHVRHVHSLQCLWCVKAWWTKFVSFAIVIVISAKFFSWIKIVSDIPQVTAIECHFYSSLCLGAHLIMSSTLSIISAASVADNKTCNFTFKDSNIPSSNMSPTYDEGVQFTSQQEWSDPQEENTSHENMSYCDPPDQSSRRCLLFDSSLK